MGGGGDIGEGNSGTLKIFAKLLMQLPAFLSRTTFSRDSEVATNSGTGMVGDLSSSGVVVAFDASSFVGHWSNLLIIRGFL